MDYEQNSSFRFEQVAWVIPRAEIEEFHATYQQLRDPSRTERANRSAHDQLNTIMMTLAGQAQTAEERDFVTELHQQVERLLNDESSHYRQCREARPPSSGPAKTALDDLHRQRFTVGCLAARDIGELCELAESHVARFKANANDGRCTREDLSINGGPTIGSMRVILNRAFHDLGIVDALSSYMGRRFWVAGMALEYSFHASTWWRHSSTDVPAPKTIYAHLDEAVGIPKAIVYLSDVTRQQGPTSCYPGAYEQMPLNALQELIGRVIMCVGSTEASRLKPFYNKPYHQSMGSEAFRRHFMKLPPALRFHSHFGWDVVAGSPAESDLVSREKVITGPRGTFLAFDGGRLLHRGGLVEHGDRVALQVVFAPEPSVPIKRRVKNAVRSMLKVPRQIVKSLLPTAPDADPSTVLNSFSAALPPVCCIDVGASYFPHEKWKIFLESPLTHWIAVEPNQKNAAYIRDWKWQATPQLVGTGLSREGGRQLLYVTNVDSGSSLFPPVIGSSMQHRVTDASRNYYFPVREVEIETLTLTQVIEKTAPTNPLLIKLDTQGSELAILQGAHEQLQNHRCVGIEIESTFLTEPIMHGSARFWEVCEYLQSLGFELLHIDPIMAESRFQQKNSRGRRWLNECDAVFMLRRDVTRALPVPYRTALLAFQLTYDFFEEALSLLDDDAEVCSLIESRGCSVAGLKQAIHQQL